MSLHLSEYLKKYKDIQQPDKIIKETIISIVQKYIGPKLQKEHIKIKGSVIVIDTESHIKNTLFIKKELILKELNKALKISTFRNIR